MGKFQDIVGKYGLPAVLMIVLALIGIVLYVTQKDKNKTIATAGIGIAITGLFIGIGTIAYTSWQVGQTTAPPPANGNGSNGSNGADQLPGGT